MDTATTASCLRVTAALVGLVTATTAALVEDTGAAVCTWLDDAADRICPPGLGGGYAGFGPDGYLVPQPRERDGL